jgi:Cu/Zn superoxide dismutase
VILAGAVAAVIALSSGSSSTAQAFTAAARPVPTNRVTGGGTATVQLNGNVATVTVDTHGLVPALHWMHIHGGTGTCPSASVAGQQNGHRFVSAHNADPIYGGVVASLTRTGDTAPSSHLDTTRYPVSGNIRYTRTFTLGLGVAKEIRAGLAVIVVHGIDYNHNRVYDNSLGRGGERSAPALCGVLSHGQTASAQNHKSSAVFVASLGLRETSAPESLAGRAWFCHVAGRVETLPLAPATTRARGSA